MIHYLKGCWKLWKIGFDLQACDDVYLLQGALKHFLYAERKAIHETEQASVFEPKYLGRPWIIQHLPQFSEAVHARIRGIRTHLDSRIPRIRIIKKIPPASPKIYSDLSAHSQNNPFLQNNEALFLTYTGDIDGVDYCEKS